MKNSMMCSQTTPTNSSSTATHASPTTGAVPGVAARISSAKASGSPCTANTVAMVTRLSGRRSTRTPTPTTSASTSSRGISNRCGFAFPGSVNRCPDTRSKIARAMRSASPTSIVCCRRSSPGTRRVRTRFSTDPAPGRGPVSAALPTMLPALRSPFLSAAISAPVNTMKPPKP
ncbi:hypothetical protein ABH935_004635 [Catenulispora sp. GAS73]|uniref:hypothetical protein n=1 Tax=Catenulispora sp. GAS73 TaxID=3156269 RepID=UPI00351613EE